MGTITAAVDASTTQGGVYRLLVTDNGTGCVTEALVTVRVPSLANLRIDYNICPGVTNCVEMGPTLSDPDHLYAWTGPNGFTASTAMICANIPGDYNLIINNCPFTLTTVSLTQNPHDPSLTTIPDYSFCQEDASTVSYTHLTLPTKA